MSSSNRSSWTRWATTGVVAMVLIIATAWVVPLPARLLTPPSTVVSYVDDTPMHVFLSPDDKWRFPTTLDDIDPQFLTALMAYEDARFRWHPGVDPIAVARAMLQNISGGRVVSGGSTLTMQLVRIAEPRRRRLWSKVVEAVRAVQLELRWSKDDILRAYLTFAPYGRNLEGVQAASWSLFGHSARQLSTAEIALLLALPQRPNSRSPSPDHVVALTEARQHVLTTLHNAGAIALTEDVMADVARSPVPTTFLPIPREAPHAAVWLRQQQPQRVRIATTLVPAVQRQAERLFNAEVSSQRHHGIGSGAVVVVDHRSGAIEALVGGDDFFGGEDGDQIPSFAVARSVGSTLKPFLYAMAIDDGRLLPETVVADVPRRFGTYSPHNFDDKFEGLVTIEAALSRSLNLPFVELLQQLGVERFVGTLRQMGARALDDRHGYYGLSVAAGAVEMTPIELAGLFVTLAGDGQPRTVTPWPGALQDPGPSLFSAGSMYLTRRALSLRDRPDFPERGRRTEQLRSIHWKTGTSFSYRDAWAVGSNAHHTVVVWRGNLDNKPSVHLVGAKASGPLLFDMLESLASPDDALVDNQVPDELTPVELCAVTGRPRSSACPSIRVAYARAARTPTEVCAAHQTVEVDIASGHEVQPGCRAHKDTRIDALLLWPAAVQRFLRRQGLRMDERPSLHRDCQPTGQPPAIVSPAIEEEVLLVPGMTADAQEMPLEAHGDGTLSWFMDGALIGQGPSSQRVWWAPVVGVHTLAVVNEQGGRAEQRLVVRTP
jgi:penicillin-binding protein 1C